MFWFILFLVAICILVYIADKKMKAKFEDKFNPKDWDLPDSVELTSKVAPQIAKPNVIINEKPQDEKQSSLLSQQQLKIFKALQSALAGEYVALTNLNAADVLTTHENNNVFVRKTSNENVASTIFDFVIYDNISSTAICAVTISTHINGLLANACKSAHLPLVHFDNEGNVDPVIICEGILQAIGAKNNKGNQEDNSALDIRDVKVAEQNIIERYSSVQSNLDDDERGEKHGPTEASSNNGTILELCPHCSSVMLKRKAKRGASEGKLFWVCSTFPKCRGSILVQ